MGGLGKIEDFGTSVPMQPSIGSRPQRIQSTKVWRPLALGRWARLLACLTAPPGSTTTRIKSLTISQDSRQAFAQVWRRYSDTSRSTSAIPTLRTDGSSSMEHETGNDFADYLLGAPDLFNQTSPQLLDSRTKYFWALCPGHTHRVSSDLTINYGLRWDVSQPFYRHQGSNPDLCPGGSVDGLSGLADGLCVSKDPGCPARWRRPNTHNRLAPRLGIAYSPGTTDGTVAKLTGGPGKTSIRVGAGMYYTAIEDITLFNEVGDAPFGLFWVSPSPVYLEEPHKRRVGQQDPAHNRFPFTIPSPGATGIWANNTCPLPLPHLCTHQQVALFNSVQSGGRARASQRLSVFPRLCGIARAPPAFHRESIRVIPRNA